jgi:hypothetical protein
MPSALVLNGETKEAYLAMSEREAEISVGLETLSLDIFLDDWNDPLGKGYRLNKEFEVLCMRMGEYAYTISTAASRDKFQEGVALILYPTQRVDGEYKQIGMACERVRSGGGEWSALGFSFDPPDPSLQVWKERGTRRTINIV